ncbi:hypothetical protein H490_0101545 [Leucobacter sp. UCD-THU]|uniref:hypothetical protein n=1 Tax=Leucobacter sp. UCD-THU TaxID=1292023 RepID=UPI00037A1EEF|nr:hypothetical protein [Leucobacter sp. UCD-THU]EYT56574.1 hypothetical protein H490_0101545 [Leucobacter sp. UCD-THU]
MSADPEQTWEPIALDDEPDPEDLAFEAELAKDPAEDDSEPDDTSESADPADNVPDPPAPINWDHLTPEQARAEWNALNEWVHGLRIRFALPPAVIPPFWHRHEEMLWQISALHTHYLGAYHPHQDGSAPMGWLADFETFKERMRELVAVSGTRIDRDRPTRQTVWPGEPPIDEASEIRIADREADFKAWVEADVARRTALEEEFLPHEGEGAEW